MTSTATRRFFDEEARRLLRFGGRSRVPGGFGWLADDGAVDASRGIHLWITGRMTRSRSEERRVGKECRSRWSPYH